MNERMLKTRRITPEKRNKKKENINETIIVLCRRRIMSVSNKSNKKS